MTIYILAGGNDRAYDDFGTKLADTIHEHIAKPKILTCHFSRDPALWQERLKSWSPWFRRYFGEDTEIQLASIEDFLDQVKGADVIYLHGGETNKTKEALDKYKNLREHFKGKIVVGSSAGTNFLSKTYFSPKRNLIDHGSGIVSVNTVVHFGAKDDGEISLSKEDWENVVIRMKSAVGDEEILFLPEGEFVSIEQ